MDDWKKSTAIDGITLECPSTHKCITSIEQKRKSQNAAKIFRSKYFGPPTLKDILRKQYIKQCKEARQRSFTQSRPLTTEEESLVSQVSIYEIMRQEVAAVEPDKDLQEVMYNELLKEYNE